MTETVSSQESSIIQRKVVIAACIGYQGSLPGFNADELTAALKSQGWPELANEQQAKRTILFPAEIRNVPLDG